MRGYYAACVALFLLGTVFAATALDFEKNSTQRQILAFQGVQEVWKRLLPAAILF
jgi:hypothetical protein